MLSNFRSALIVCAVLEFATTASAQQLVYRNTFRDGADSRWSRPLASQTPSGRSFLGPFTKEPVTLSLTDLPPHTRVTIAFSLFAIGAWAGSDAKGGPDIWEFGEAGAARQVYSTFATTGNTQSYPAPYPQGLFSRGSWTFESNTLRYFADSVFHIQRTFTHSASELLLEFRSSGERWGLDNVEVWVTPTELAANAWGYGALYGQVGNDQVESQPEPRGVGGVKDVIAVAGGDFHSLALSADGSIWGWGDNGVGQTVNGTGPIPRRITSPSGEALPPFSAVASGPYTALALGPRGTLWTWGANGSGQAGLGLTSLFTPPTQVAKMDSFVAVAAGSEHSVALRADGSVWSWGRNDYGQLGLGFTGPPVATAKLVIGLRNLGANIVAIAAGEHHVLAVDSRGRVWGWGYDESSQLGTTDLIVPSPRQLADGALSVAAGLEHSLVLMEDGRVRAFGDDHAGQLGNGFTTGNGYVLNAAGGYLTGAIAVSASGQHSIVLTDDGMWGFGRNTYGQLGSGGYSDAEGWPVHVNDSSGMIAMAGGLLHSLGVGPAPIASAAPSDIDFGEQVIGSSSASRSVTLTNTGSSNLWVLGVDVFSEEFNATSTDCNSVIPPGYGCRTEVTFTPVWTGLRNGMLQFRTNIPARFISAALSGSGKPVPTVTASNEAPAAHDQAVSVPQNTSTQITLTASDANGDPLTFTIVNSPAHGTLNGTAPNLTYTPVAGYLGMDSFTFQANDGKVDSNVATVWPAVVDDTAITFTGAGVNSATRTPLGAEATFSFDPSTMYLTVELTNTSLADVQAASDVLTAVFFSVENNPSFIPVSATLPPGTLVLFGPDGGGNMGGEWAYAGAISGPNLASKGLSTAVFDIFGSGNLRGYNLDGTASVENHNYGITSAGDNPGTGDRAVTGDEPLIRNSVRFRVKSGVNLDPRSVISNVSFQYGTSLTADPNLPGR